MTLYLERDKVRAILCGVVDEDVHVAEGLLADIDALPIVTIDHTIPAQWAEFYRKYHPAIEDLQELIRRFSYIDEALMPSEGREK